MKLNYKRTFFIGFIFFSISMFWNLYDNIIPRLLRNDFNLEEGVIGVIMALDNIVALFMLPLFGHLSDKTNTKWGKRTPYIVCGTILAVLTFVFTGLFADQKSLVPFMFTLGLVLIFMSTYRSPAVALMPDLTAKPLRSKANAVINLMGAFGGLISLFSIKFLFSDDKSIMPLFSVICGIILISLVIFLLNIKESKLLKLQENDQNINENEQINIKTAQTEQKTQNNQKLEKAKFKSLIFLLASVFLWFMAYNSITTFFSIYAQEVWNIQDGQFTIPLIIAQISATIMFIPIGFFSSKFGRKKTILTGISIMIFSFLSAFFIGSNLFGIKIDLYDGFFTNPISFVMIFLFIVTGIGWATINVNSYPMVVEMCLGTKSGKYTGFYYTASMTGQVLTPVLSGLVMQHLSNKLLFLYASVFIILALVTMIFVRHGDSKPEKKTALENFDNDM